MHLDAEKEMMSQCVALLGKFIAVREPNIRYLGLVSAFLLNCSFTYLCLILVTLRSPQALKVESFTILQL